MALLSISSLLCTAYILAFQPNVTSKQIGAIQGKTPPQWKQESLQTYVLPLLNGVLTLVIGLHTFTFYDKQGVLQGFWLMCMLPAGTSQRSRSKQAVKGLTVEQQCYAWF